METREKITQRILASPKYKPLLPRTVEAAVRKCLARFGEKRAEDKARALLHRSWGAYWPARPRFGKLLERLRADVAAGKGPREAVKPLLALHSSTRERPPDLADFYSRIFAVTDAPSSVLDLACGMNPITVPWMNLPAGCRYLGTDIDTGEVDFLNSALELLGYDPDHAAAAEGDALADTPPPADVILVLKFLPLIESMHKDISAGFLGNLNGRVLVVSFPSASLSGGKRKMGEFHAETFLTLAKEHNWKTERLDFPGEVVFIVRKQGRSLAVPSPRHLGGEKGAAPAAE